MAKRLSHVNYKTLLQLRRYGKIKFSDYQEKINNCVVCYEAIISVSSSKTRKPLELMQSDLNGKQSKSFGRAKYFLTSLDYSRELFIDFLKNKTENLGKFKEYKALVENQTERKIRIYNGTEYENSGMEKVFTENGMLNERTIPHTPEQNGRVSV